MSHSDERIASGQSSLAFLALLQKISDDRPWFADARCADADPDLFFPAKGEQPTEGKRVCALCPVSEECFEAGQDELYGVWGATSVEERREFRRRRDIA